MSDPEQRTLEERVLALEDALLPPVFTYPEQWTDEQAAELKARLEQQMESGDFRLREVKVLPPGRPVLTPEIARALLAECVTVVKPGEVLVIRYQDWTPYQAQEYQRYADAATAEGRIPFKVLVVTGDQLAVAEAGQ